MKKIIQIFSILFLIYGKSFAQPGLLNFNTPSGDLWRDAYKESLVKSIDEKLKGKPRQQFFNRKELRRAQNQHSGGYEFWADTSIMKSSALTGLFNFQTGSLATEWLVDGFGVWRLSAGSALTIAKDSSVKDFQSFINGGGNLFVKAVTPFFVWVNATHPSKRYFTLYFSPKVGAVLPGLGQSQSDSINWNIDGAVEAHLKIAGNQEKVAIFSVIRSGLCLGSKSFVQNITSDKRQFFGYTVGSVGLVLNKNIVVQLNFPIRMKGTEDPIDKVPASISLSILNGK